MPYPNWHSARVQNPALFLDDSFRNKELAPGVEVILAKKSADGAMEVQAYRFAVSKFTVEEAKAWIKENDIKGVISFEEAAGEKIKAFLSLQCLKTELSASDILALVDPGVLEGIRAKDAHPFFQAYSICHEGTSQPTILGDTARPIHWTRQAIQSIKKVITKGIKFFFRHNSDNSTDNRNELGEVVADAQKEIAGKLHHIVIGYFPDKAKVQALDVCSQEADWNLFEEAGRWIAGTIEKLTGIALSKSTIDKPAFDGAVRLGMVQAFETVIDDPEKVDQNNTDPGDGKGKTMNKDDVLKAVKELNLHPAQIFTMDDLKADRVFGKILDDNETLKAQVEDKDKAIALAKVETEKTAKQVQSLTAGSRMKKLIADGAIKLTDKQKAFIEKRFVGDIADPSDEGIKKFIDAELAIFKTAMETAGVTEEAPPTNAGNADAEDMTKMKNNPHLTEDFDLDALS